MNIASSEPDMGNECILVGVSIVMEIRDKPENKPFNLGEIQLRLEKFALDHPSISNKIDT